WYTVNATATGQKESGASVVQYSELQNVKNPTAGKVKYDQPFNVVYGLKNSGTLFTTSDIAMTEGASGTVGAAYGYIDYVFYLKATGDNDNQNLNMTECNLLYNGNPLSGTTGSGTAGVDIDRAWRVGVFVAPLNAATEGGKGLTAVQSIDPAAATNVNANQKAILGLENSAYFTATNGGQAQQNATTLADVVNFKNGAAGATGVVLDTVDRGETAYYKVLLRVWLEGEDNTCNTATYASLQDGKWALNCKFELGQGTAVTGLNSDAAKKASSGTTQNAVNNEDVS
ncbi:MAG: hypothetical protein IJ906_09015, partial [Oscillospiraceae bacterium]|nr:hypothetical protein [Oscillospiraceae bacterium]